MSSSKTSSSAQWKSAVDPRTGRTYYYHEVTRETQWRKPMELASDEERRAMEEKERKQKDFFAAMEANILNSLSQGQVPGTDAAKKTSMRRKSSRKPPQGEGRPDLVRTISTMDETVLKDLVRRQPSFRNVLNKQQSLQPADLPHGKRGSAISASAFESFVSIKDEQDRLDSVLEASGVLGDSMPDLFSYDPNDEDSQLENSDDSGFDMSPLDNDGGEHNQSSLAGFGLTWEETKALKKLADITKEMMDAENDEDYDLQSTEEAEAQDNVQRGVAGSTPSWKGAKGGKTERNLPIEIELTDDDDDDETDSRIASSLKKSSAPPANAVAGAFQKARDIGGRELEFDSSEDEEEDEEEESDKITDLASPSSRKLSTTTNGTKSSQTEEDIAAVRPEVKRRNTCGTLYVGTTMSAPDKDATIKCVCGVYRTHILSSEHDDSYDPARNPFRVFNDLESEQGGYEIEFLNDEKTTTLVPSLDEITRFYRDTFYKAQMENDCIIMSLIYVERLIKRTNGLLRPRAYNWRSLIFSCMILSSKVWDDLSMWNADFSQSCPPGVSFPLQRINQLELAVLNALNFQVKVPASEYAKYYFLLRSMLIKSGLGGDETGAMDPLDVMGARRLQEVSSNFENLRVTDPGAFSKRSQSLATSQISRRTKASNTQPKLNLEHVVKL